MRRGSTRRPCIGDRRVEHGARHPRYIAGRRQPRPPGGGKAPRALSDQHDARFGIGYHAVEPRAQNVARRLAVVIGTQMRYQPVLAQRQIAEPRQALGIPDRDEIEPRHSGYQCERHGGPPAWLAHAA